jgi:hypothetical protein
MRPAIADPMMQPYSSELNANPPLVAEREVLHQERPGAADDGDIETEQQSAGRGGRGQEQHVGQVDLVAHRAGRKLSDCEYPTEGTGLVKGGLAQLQAPPQ